MSLKFNRTPRIHIIRENKSTVGAIKIRDQNVANRKHSPRNSIVAGFIKINGTQISTFGVATFASQCIRDGLHKSLIFEAEVT